MITFFNKLLKSHYTVVVYDLLLFLGTVSDMFFNEVLYFSSVNIEKVDLWNCMLVDCETYSAMQIIHLPVLLCKCYKIKCSLQMYYQYNFLGEFSLNSAGLE